MSQKPAELLADIEEVLQHYGWKPDNPAYAKLCGECLELVTSGAVTTADIRESLHQKDVSSGLHQHPVSLSDLPPSAIRESVYGNSREWNPPRSRSTRPRKRAQDAFVKLMDRSITSAHKKQESTIDAASAWLVEYKLQGVLSAEDVHALSRGTKLPGQELIHYLRENGFVKGGYVSHINELEAQAPLLPADQRVEIPAFIRQPNTRKFSALMREWVWAASHVHEPPYFDPQAWLEELKLSRFLKPQDVMALCTGEKAPSPSLSEYLASNGLDRVGVTRHYFNRLANQARQDTTPKHQVTVPDDLVPAQQGDMRVLSFKVYLSILRKNAKLSRKEAAEAINKAKKIIDYKESGRAPDIHWVGEDVIYKWENINAKNFTLPPAEMLEAIAEAYHTSYDFLWRMYVKSFEKAPTSQRVTQYRPNPPHMAQSLEELVKSCCYYAGEKLSVFKQETGIRHLHGTKPDNTYFPDSPTLMQKFSVEEGLLRLGKQHPEWKLDALKIRTMLELPPHPARTTTLEACLRSCLAVTDMTQKDLELRVAALEHKNKNPRNLSNFYHWCKGENINTPRIATICDVIRERRGQYSPEQKRVLLKEGYYPSDPVIAEIEKHLQELRGAADNHVPGEVAHLKYVLREIRSFSTFSRSEFARMCELSPEDVARMEALDDTFIPSEEQILGIVKFFGDDDDYRTTLLELRDRALKSITKDLDVPHDPKTGGKLTDKELTVRLTEILTTMGGERTDAQFAEQRAALFLSIKKGELTLKQAEQFLLDPQPVVTNGRHQGVSKKAPAPKERII